MWQVIEQCVGEGFSGHFVTKGTAIDKQFNSAFVDKLGT